MQVVAAAVVVAIEMPWALLSLIPGGLLFYFIQKWYRNSSRELRRLVALSNSPVFDHFSATLRSAQPASTALCCVVIPVPRGAANPYSFLYLLFDDVDLSSIQWIGSSEGSFSGASNDLREHEAL